jgi:two-component system chemotaxis sensor kinase CheA
MDDFETEIKLGFLEEATQLLADTEQCFLSLETSSGDPTILEKIFRLAHNLKGSAKAVGFEELSHFTHQLESLLLKMKNGEIAIQSAAVDLLLRANDHIRIMLEGLRVSLTATFDSTSLLAEIAAAIRGELPAVQETAVDSALVEEVEATPPSQDLFPEEDPVVEPAPIAVLETVAVPLSTPTTPAMAPAKLSMVEPAQNEAPKIQAPPDESIRVSFSRLERLLNFVGELVILQTMLREQGAKIDSPLVRRTIEHLGKVTKEVQDISMSLRMVPLKQTFQKMQRIVRDTARTLDKKINLELSGEDTEVDKTLLEKLGDPLVHMIRNAVDHGIETTEKRRAANKSETGTIRLAAFHRSGSLVIEIRDDGAGLDAERLKAKAIEKGILKPGVQMSDREAHMLIFASGFSTKTEVTDVSGRGVGMDVVRTNITQLQGEIQIETEIGKGSCFRIILPLTLAIIDSMVIRSAQDQYVIPLSHVQESLLPSPKDIKQTTNLGDILILRGENMPIFKLSELLGAPPAKTNVNSIAIVVRTLEQPFAVFVDDIIGQQQVVVKALGQELRHVKGFSGSAILGNGRPALILELSDLVTKIKGGSSHSAQKGPIAI